MKKKLIGKLALLLVIAACTDAIEDHHADSVYVGGVIYTANESEPWSSGVAIKGDRIVYVGDGAAAYIGPATAVYDLSGKLVIPGLIDAHTHPALVALGVGQFVLDESYTKEELLATIRKTVAERPDEDVLVGGFWLNEIFDVTGPHKEDLDTIESDRPLIIYDDWSHTLWVNSVALEQGGITRDTKDIVPGFSFYQKDLSGEPTGWIVESAASVFINKFWSVSPAVEESTLELLTYLRNLGVTTVFDAGNFGLDEEVYAALSRLDKEGRLPIRYHGVYTLFLPDDYAGAIDELKRLGDTYNTDNLRIDTLKVFFDGVLETRTAAVSSDYLDTPGNSGEGLLSREQLHQLILKLDAEGLNLHVHGVGDRAITTVLDAVQDAHESLQRAPRIRIAITHLEKVKETDFPRFKELGVIAQLTPQWVSGGDLSWYEAGIGDAAFEMQRMQTFIDKGAVVTFSSDIYSPDEWPADRANPFLGMQVGHNRQGIGADPESVAMPPIEDRIHRDELVNGYTTNAAYQLGRENELGKIAVGYQADLVVLNQNLFEVNRYEIHKTKPVAVIMDGEIVHGDLDN